MPLPLIFPTMNSILYKQILFIFFPSSPGAVAVFGFKERWIVIGFTILSFILFTIAVFKPSEFYPEQSLFYESSVLRLC